MATRRAAGKKAAKKKKKVAPKKKIAKKASRKFQLLAAVSLKAPPILWRVDTGSQAVGLWVSDDVWAANERGEIFRLTKDGDTVQSFKLPKAVLCLLADEVWRFAGCNNGKVYDLTGRVPRALYEIEGGKQLDWLEMYRGILCVSDHEGGLTVIDADGSVRWQKRDKAAKFGWMVRADATGLWHGSMAGLRKYTWDGNLEWTVTNLDDVRFGWPVEDELVVVAGWEKRKKATLHVLDRKGKPRLTWPVLTEQSGYSHTGGESCGASMTKDGALRLYTSSGGFLFCVDGTTGEPLWEARTGIGSACTMQADGERLYVVTTDGVIACIDVSDEAIERAQRGKLPKARHERASKVSAAETQLETTSDTSKGVILECVKEGSKLRMKVVSAGYHAGWYCQFPRDLREEGARYVVDELREATQGGFYRVLGDIKRLV